MTTKVLQLCWLTAKVVAFCALVTPLLTADCLASGPPPVITVQPSNQSVSKNGTATFSVTATSTTTLSYQWYYYALIFNVPIAGATNSTFVISNATTVATLFPYYCSVINAGGTVNSSQVYLAVTNNPPVANNDNYTTPENVAINSSSLTPITVTNYSPTAVNQLATNIVVYNLPSVLSNDTDANGNSLTAVLVSNVSYGALTFNSNGTFSYFPNQNYVGTDSFTYMANDGMANSAVATVNITVTAGVITNLPTTTNLPPVAVNDSYVVPENVSLPYPIYLNSLTNGWVDDSSNCTNNFSNTLPVLSGSYSISANITGAYGGVQLYHVDMVNSGYSAVSFWVNGGATGGQQLQIYGDLGTPPASPIVILPLAPPSANAWRQYTFTLASLGVANVTNFTGFTIQDSAGSAEPTFYLDDIQLVGLAATSNTATTFASVLANDTDPNGNSLTAILVSNVNNGALTFNSDGTFSYLPNINFVGTDSFTYVANDGMTNSALATVAISVTGATNICLPPLANTGVAGGVTANTATLNATINPQGSTVNYFFQYGTTTNYGQFTTTVTLPAGTNLVNAIANISQLTPGVLYHYTVVVSGSGGTVAGSDMTFSTLLYDTATVTLLTNGLGGISPALNGTVLNVGQNYTVTATPAASGVSFFNWTDGNGAIVATNQTMTFVMMPNSSYTANFLDVTKPTVVITSPTANSIGSNGVILASGTAGDNISVSSVYLNLNSGGWSAATTVNHWTNWNAPIYLIAGTNTLSAYAVDVAGNISRSNTISFVYVPVANLTVRTNGRGSITPQLAGSLLKIGQSYSLKALPATGFAFTNWTDAQGNVIGSSPVLTFVMASNLVVTGNFVDVSKPILTITTPAIATTAVVNTTNKIYVLLGKASDNVGIAGVKYKLNAGGWHDVNTANGWTNWSATLELAPGTNVLTVYAVDTTGLFSKTNQFTFAYLTAPVSLAGLKVTIQPDIGPAFESAFGATAFSQSSKTTNYSNSVGTYTYTRLTANTARLTQNYTAPPLSTNSGKQTILIGFTSPAQAQFTNLGSGSTGTMLLEAVPVLAATTVTSKSLIYIGSQGQGTSNSYTANTYVSLNLTTGLPSTGSSYTYSTYGPAGALLKQTDTNGLTYIVATFDGTNYGRTYSESYNSTGNLMGTAAGTFGLVSQRPGGNAPANLFNAELTFQSLGSWFKLSLATNRFAQFSTSDTNDCGVGSYTYGRTSTNAGNLTLNFTAPLDVAGSISLAQMRFFAPNLAYYTNNDGTVGGAVLGKAESFAPVTLAAVTLNATNDATGNLNQFNFNADGSFSIAGYLSSAGSYTFAAYSVESGLAQLTFTGGILAGDIGALQLDYSGQGSGKYLLSIFDSNNNLLGTSRGVFGQP